MDKLREYTFRIENEQYLLEYIYVAHDAYSETKIKNADVKVRLLKQPNPLSPYLPYILLWELSFTNQKLRSVPFYSFQFGCILEDFVFVVLENRLLKIELKSGTVLLEKSIGNTNIEQVGSYKKQILLLSDSHEFDLACHSNNLRMVDYSGETLWIAEKASDFEYYFSYDALRTSNEKLEAYSGSLLITLDDLTGKKISSQLVK